MKLTDPWFEAEFVGHISESGSFRRQGADINGAQAVLLYGPCCYGQDAGAHGVIVPFANPRNAPPVPANFEPTPRWIMAGSGLHDLTITPSVDCTAEKPEHVEARRAAGFKPGECSRGRMCWHGFITNGEVT